MSKIDLKTPTGIRREVLPFIGLAVVISLIVWSATDSARLSMAFCVIVNAYLLFFFRDPERRSPVDPAAVLSGADGRVMSVVCTEESTVLKTQSIRISIFLNIFDVHVNRAPISGNARFIGYFPGKTHFAFREKSSERNQHNKILIEGERIRCLVVQLVGPVARRVVYWLNRDQPTPVIAGDRIGMMKFGSRLDVYFPCDDIDVLVKPGDLVRAGETPIGRIRQSMAHHKEKTVNRTDE